MSAIHLSNHLKLESTATIQDADTIILGIPYDGTSTHYPGSRTAPYEARREFLELEKDGEKDFWETVKYHDAGNIEVVHADTGETLKRIRETVEYLRSQNPDALLATIGGEHLITLPIIRAQPDIKKIIALDAHLDLKDEYMGVSESHATVLRRIHEMGKKLSIHGARSYDAEEKKYADQNNITVTEKIPEEIAGQAGKNTHATIDLDVVNPCQMPGVGNPTPGGPAYTELEKAAKQLAEKTGSIDLVEANPLLDKTAPIAAAQLLLTILKSRNG